MQLNRSSHILNMALRGIIKQICHVLQVHLTLVDQQWEVGGTQGSLTWTDNMYSLKGSAWLTQDQRSIGVVSFGAAANQTLKSSHIVSVVDPTQPWGRLTLGLENEHLGVFPHSFQVR